MVRIVLYGELDELDRLTDQIDERLREEIAKGPLGYPDENAKIRVLAYVVLRVDEIVQAFLRGELDEDIVLEFVDEPVFYEETEEYSLYVSRRFNSVRVELTRGEEKYVFVKKLTPST